MQSCLNKNAYFCVNYLFEFYMEKQKVYIETSVIGYLTAKPSRDI